MGKNSPVVLYRRGFGSSLVLGFCGTFCVVTICATCVAIYGVKVVNDRLDGLIDISPAAISALANWQSALPPAVHDALHDRRMPEYRDKVQVTASLVRDWQSDRLIPVVDVTNEGDQIVSLMSLRLQVEDEDQLPVQEFTVYAATPLAIDAEWRGPLLPGSQRRFRAPHMRDLSPGELNVRWEISELRVWNAEDVAAGALSLTPPAAASPDDELAVKTRETTSR